MPEQHHSTTCQELLHDPRALERRAHSALDAFARLHEYRDLLRDVDALNDDERGRCPGLSDALPDRAYDAEAAGRVLIAHGLQTLNELRDSGQLYDTMRAFAAETERADVDELASRLEKHIDESRASDGDGAASLLHEAAAHVRAANLTVSCSRQRIVLNRPGVAAEQEEVMIALERRPGQRGRVSVDEFFSPTDVEGRVLPGRVYAPRDCHHRPIRVRPVGVAVDAYAGALAGLAATKASLYQHARRADELDHRSVRGNDPLTAILTGIAIVGVALIIYGAATGNGYLLAFGVVLVIGAALVAFGGFGLVLAVVA